MGVLVLPTSGKVYLDANCFIYSVERIEPYREALDIVWQAVSVGQIAVITSELTLLEVLVKPLKARDTYTATTFRTMLQHTPDVMMLPITQKVLEEAANLRAIMNIKTPDALHAATALLSECTLFMSNDGNFRRVPDLPVTILSEIVPLDTNEPVTQQDDPAP